MEAATPIGRSYLDQGYKIEFFSENKQIIAKIYQKNESLVGNCILDNPSDEANCTYESLTEFAKSKIDSLLNNHKALLQPRKLTSEANQEVNTDIKCLSQSVFVPCISPLSIVPPFDPFFDENTMRSKILEFFEDLKRNGKIITNNELKNGNYFSWKGKTNFTRLVGREYLASLIQSLGLKHIKVPEKKVFLTNTSTEQALVNFKVEQLNGDSRIGIISDDLKILAEPIKSDDRCLSEQEINELFILLENSHYRDFDLGNFVPSKDGLYIIDTELKSFAGDQVWGKLSRLREAGCIQENNKPLFDELIQKKIQKFSQEKPNFCYRQLKFLVDQHENGITTDRIDEYKALIKKYEEVNFSIGKVFAFKRSELNL